jgi:hypothetical protein
MYSTLEWSPIRWPNGPKWNNPSTLDLVRGTPINCLIVTWNQARQKALQRLIDRGRREGLAFVGLIEDEADRSTGIASARAAGLSAVASEHSLPDSEFPVIPWVTRSNLTRQTPSTLITISDGVWPSIKMSADGEDNVVEAGPTGIPWVDSNGWFVRLARTLAPQKSIWVVADPPDERVPLRTESYMLAVADAAACGGRWVVSLDDDFSARLVAGNAPAISDWKKIINTLAFFEKHREWRDYESAGLLAVLSDFSGENEFLATETVNLLTRRHLPFRILAKSNAFSTSLEGLKAIFYPDREPPDSELRDALLGFVGGGGLLICPSACGTFASGSRPADQTHPRFEVRSLGAGRLAVAKDELLDPYVLAVDTHILMSRRNDLVRMWNAGSTNSYYFASSDGGKAVVQILNYASRPANYVSLRVLHPYHSGRLWTLQAEAPVPLQVVSGRKSAEFHLPSFSVCATLELEK